MSATPLGLLLLFDPLVDHPRVHAPRPQGQVPTFQTETDGIRWVRVPTRSRTAVRRSAVSSRALGSGGTSAATEAFCLGFDLLPLRALPFPASGPRCRAARPAPTAGSRPHRRTSPHRPRCAGSPDGDAQHQQCVGVLLGLVLVGPDISSDDTLHVGPGCGQAHVGGLGVEQHHVPQ